MTGPDPKRRRNKASHTAPTSTLAGAVSFHQAGDLPAAEAAYRELLAVDPELGDAWNNLGLLLNAQNRLDEALTALQAAARCQPSNPRAHANLGVVLRRLNRNDEARAAQQAALQCKPDFAPAHNNLGNLLHAAGAFAAAKTHFERACQIDPKVFEHHFMLGKCLLELREYDAAWAALRRALAIEPGNADAHGTLAKIWMDQLRMPEALACYDEGLTRRPDYEPLRYNRGLARLLNGDLPGGFADYEARWQVPDFPSKRLATDKPDWRGEAMPQGSLLLHAEQGLGDTLQMLRYLPQVAARVGQVWLVIQAPLRGLVDLPPNVKLLADGEKFPPYDAICPLLSLPHIFASDILNLPAPIPYLRVDPERQSYWRQRLAPGAASATLRVGLVWAGNPKHSNDANRSLPLAQLKPLLNLPGIQCYALQVGSGREALAQHPEIIDLGPELKDFTDTAAALEQLDLLISVDTSIVHLAGALGLPVWLLLPLVPDWRWLLDRDDSPWYPSLTIFRQPAHGAWPAVVAQLAATLKAMQGQPAAQAAEHSTEDGRLQLEQGQGDAAERCFWKALRQRPWHGRAMSGLAVLAWKQNRPADALVFGARACRLDPNNPEAWSNYGAYLKGNARHDAALACFDEAVARFPSNASLRYNRGLARLLNGDLAGGLDDYETRWQVPDFPSKRLVTDKPDWRGEAWPQGSLLLHAEQGLGDTLQMLRYLPQVAARVGQVWLLVQAPLRALVVLPPNVTLLSDGEKFPPYDAVCPLLSLPHIFATTLATIPARLPYLHVAPERLAHWQKRLAGSALAGTLRIGLTWAGNPGHRNDANRSLPLAQLKPLLALPGVQTYALQVGSGREALTQYPEIIDLGPELKDFTDTAAALEQLDLLISVDTSIVHLAGALGLPVWLLLPQVPDWRWLLERDESPWYPSLTLFRQPAHGAWPAVVTALAEAVQALRGSTARAAAEQSVEAGRSQLMQGQGRAAEGLFWQALRQRPVHGRALSGLAVLAWQQQRPDAALVFGARACRLEPDNAETWSNQGAYLKARQRYDEALLCQQRALAIAPDNPTALSNLSNLLGKLERWPEAKAPAERALQLAPQGADFHYNAGIVFKELAEFDRALHHFAEAQRLAGGHVKAQLHEAMVHLLRGDFARGWPAYESRWQQPDCKEKHSFTCPLWQGQDLTGKTILLYSEQGLGDSFQFMRYAPLVAERAGRTLLVVQKEVEALARRMPGKHEVFTSGTTLPDYDFHCPLLSLPLAFGTTVETVPANIPYLRCDEERQAHWQQRLATLPQGRLKVGLVWAGRPTHGNDHNRSLRLAHFAPLLADPHFAWVALQKGPAVTEAAAYAASLTVLDGELRDFDDTAAALSQLDLLLTVDTSVAHLAGALGVRTLILLPCLPDWRWLWQRSDSPWYPSVTLLRQTERGAWPEVIARLHTNLLETKDKKWGA